MHAWASPGPRVSGDGCAGRDRGRDSGIGLHTGCLARRSGPLFAGCSEQLNGIQFRVHWISRGAECQRNYLSPARNILGIIVVAQGCPPLFLSRRAPTDMRPTNCAAAYKRGGLQARRPSAASRSGATPAAYLRLLDGKLSLSLSPSAALELWILFFSVYHHFGRKYYLFWYWISSGIYVGIQYYSLVQDIAVR